MKHIVDMTEMQEQHLDLMIKLAFDLDDAESIQQLLTEPDPVLSKEDEFLADQILAKAFSSVEHEQNDIKKQHIRRAAQSALSKVMRIAACLIIMLSLVVPLMFTASAEFRAQVLEMLIQFDSDRGEARFQFVERPTETVSVPTGWTGDFFPTYLPDGFEVAQLLEDFTLVRYQSGDTQIISFSENDASVSASSGTDDASITYIDINGSRGCVIDGYSREGNVHAVSITWAINDRWFSLVTKNIETDEAIYIARSVKRIHD